MTTTTTTTTANEERCFRETPYPHPSGCIGCMATDSCTICGAHKAPSKRCNNHRDLTPPEPTTGPTGVEEVAVKPYQIEAAAKLLHPKKPFVDVSKETTGTSKKTAKRPKGQKEK